MNDLLQTGGLFWVTSRAAGTAALVLASLAVGIGLLSSSRGNRRARRSPSSAPCTRRSRSRRSALSLVHGLSLLGDQYVGYSPTEIAVPFASNYQTFWTGLGVIAFWGLAALGLSYYQRKRGSARPAGGRCTASRRPSGSSGWSTRSAWAPTAARPGSC